LDPKKINLVSAVFLFKFLVIKTIDPDSYPESLEMPDLESMNPDSQHCFLEWLTVGS
jgi:hypothetical protein